MDKSQQIPIDWGRDYLTSFLDACMNNTYAIFQNQHEWYRRLSDIDQTYHKLNDNLDSNPELYGGLFALRCHSAYLGASRLVLSGQVPETFMLLRGCLEAALYGLYCISQRIPMRGRFGTIAIRTSNVEKLSNLSSQFRISNGV